MIGRAGSGDRSGSDPGAPAARLPLQELVGRKLGDYSIKRVLGHGSMGVVFEAVHEQLGRRVALKALPPGLGATGKAIQRFLREAQAVAQLSHENIVPIYEIAVEGSIHYYAMQFLEGEPLDRVVRRGPLDPREAARLACTAARAIHFAHQRGIIHRDIKPANLIVDGNGRIVLTDFGLARPEHGGAITDSGAMVGTPLYMSPEQVRARRGEVDRRTDVYSLGATLYEMLTGMPPFPGESTQEILQAILEQEPRPPRALKPAVPADLEVVVMKALEKEPRRRYTSALELAQDLERFLENEPVLARRTTVVARAWRRIRKHKAIALLSAAVALVLLGFSYAMKRQHDDEQNRSFSSAMESARAAFADESFLTALDKFEEALRQRRGDPAARLGRGRALCFLGQEWENENVKLGRETRPKLAEQFTSVDKLYAAALSDISTVADVETKNALALFYRGFLRWRSRERLVRDAGVEDLVLAETLGEEDWETQSELAKFRLGLANDPRRDAAQRGELLQQALANAGHAVKLVDDRAATLPARVVGRSHRLRAEIYSQLFDLGGNATIYLDLIQADCERALANDPRDRHALDLLENVASRRKDAQKGGDASPTPASSDSPTNRPELARSLLTILGVAEKSEQSKALAGLLQRGGELLAAGWQEADVQGRANRFLDRYAPGGVGVSEEARSEAAAEAEAARRILQEGLRRGSLSASERATVRDHLRRAAKKNPRNAQYFFDLAVVEQDLGDFESARGDLEQATRIASSNPLFFHHLALVCEQLRRPGEAAVHARRTEELAPENPDFIANHARLALDAESAEADAARRAALHEEASSAVARLERLAPQHAQLAALRTRLVPTSPRSPERDG